MRRSWLHIERTYDFLQQPCGFVRCVRRHVLGWGKSSPIPKPAHAFCQISSRLELGIYDCAHVELGEVVADQSSKVLGKASEGVISSLGHGLVLAVLHDEKDSP